MVGVRGEKMIRAYHKYAAQLTIFQQKCSEGFSQWDCPCSEKLSPQARIDDVAHILSSHLIPNGPLTKLVLTLLTIAAKKIMDESRTSICHHGRRRRTASPSAPSERHHSEMLLLPPHRAPPTPQGLGPTGLSASNAPNEDDDEESLLPTTRSHHDDDDGYYYHVFSFRGTRPTSLPKFSISDCLELIDQALLISACEDENELGSVDSDDAPCRQ